MVSDSDYEYRDLLAKSWDFLRGDTSDFPDRQFFQDMVDKSGEPILDVGCGTGRLLLEYLVNGSEVDGMDVSPEMLAICQQKASEQSLQVNLYNQAMESMALPRHYQTIIVPSMSFQLMPDLADAENALDGFFRHLLPGGTLVLSIWHSKRKGKAEWGDWWLVHEREGYEGNKGIKRWERSMHDPSTQIRHSENRYELLENGKIVYTELHRRSPELRNYSLSQVTSMLEKAGYVEVRAVSEYTNDPATDEDGTFCLFGVRP
jgi:ubiquinone/menaquinone biosynthesis C-methylase UbiE